MTLLLLLTVNLTIEVYSVFSLIKAKKKKKVFMCFLRNLNVESSLVWKKGLEKGIFQRNKTSKPLDKIESNKKMHAAFVRDFSLAVLWYGRTVRESNSAALSVRRVEDSRTCHSLQWYLPEKSPNPSGC